MRHNISLAASRFSLRPVETHDAEFIAALRGDHRLNRFINESSPRIEDQIAWIEHYYNRSGEWYFIIEETASGQKEGTIGIYDFDPGGKTAEWGRWIIRSGSLAAIESAILIYRVAFEIIELSSVFCRTVADNSSVVSFHDSMGACRTGILTDHVKIRGQEYDSIEHTMDTGIWDVVAPRLEALAVRLNQRTGRSKDA